MHLVTYLSLLREAEGALASSYRTVGDGHAAEADVRQISALLARQCETHAQALTPAIDRYREDRETEPDRTYPTALGPARSGGLGLLRDLHDLYALCSFVDITWTLVGQGAKGRRDSELLDVVTGCEAETAIQLAWLTTRMKAAAPQALLLAR